MWRLCQSYSTEITIKESCQCRYDRMLSAVRLDSLGISLHMTRKPRRRRIERSTRPRRYMIACLKNVFVASVSNKRPLHI